MRLVYFTLTAQAETLAGRLRGCLPGELVTRQTLSEEGISFSEQVARSFAHADGLVFIMAAGIVVRTIAPLLKSKTTDPAVVVADAAGAYYISLLSGHLGGANALARALAAACGGQAVITTGTDVAKTEAFDLFAQRYHCRIENIRELKVISGAMIAALPVRLYTPWEPVPQLPANVEVCLVKLPVRKQPSSEQAALRQAERKPRTGISAVFVGHCFEEPQELSGYAHVLYLRPRNLYLGVGCKKDVPAQDLLAAFADFMKRTGTDARELAGIMTIARKKDEPALEALCAQQKLPLLLADEDEIRELERQGLVESSPFVRQTTGVGSVSEAASLLAAASAGGGRTAADACRLLAHGRVRQAQKKTRYPGITFALAQHMPWRDEDGDTADRHQS